MFSAALMCDTRWTTTGQQNLREDTKNSAFKLIRDKKNVAEEMNDSLDQEIEFQDCSEIGTMLLHGESEDGGSQSTMSSPQHVVARQDSGVPEEIPSPCAKDSASGRTNDEERREEEGEEEEDPNDTMNSDCNITVIHVKPDNIESNVSLATDSNTVADETQENEATPRDFTPDSKDSKDGSDSGVEGCVSELPRVEYANSLNGMDEASCDSSLVSCCSVYEDPCAILPEDSRMAILPGSNGAVGGAVGGGGGGGEGTSEGGSESSSLAGSVGGPRGLRSGGSIKRNSFASSSSSNISSPASSSKRKPNVIDSSIGKTTNSQISGSSTTPRLKVRSSSSATPRSTSSSRSLANNASRDRGRSRESRSGTRDNSVSNNPDRRISTNTQKFRIPATPHALNSTITIRNRTRPIPDSLPSVLTTEIDRDLAAQRGRNSATNSARSRGGSCSSRGRVNTPGSTPSEDSRKSLLSGTPKSLGISKNLGNLLIDEKTIDTYATLPRRNKINVSMSKSVDRADDFNGKIDCKSTSRDASLSRSINASKKPRINSTRDNVNVRKCLPPYPRVKVTEKTRIYHETSVQTGLTCQDIDKALAGLSVRPHNPEDLERSDRESQTESTWHDQRAIQTQLKNLTAETNQLKQDNSKLESDKTKLEKLLNEERADHAFARKELDRNASRVLAMLGTPQSEQPDGSDSFLELETHFQSSGQVVANQQIEITDLQSLCRMLNRDLEKSLAAQKALLQQQQDLEAESTEMQDFLQEEKATLAEALRDAENEIAMKDELLVQRDKELARLTEECKHLVRISEQRRQENLSLGMKMNAVERRGRDLLLGQGAAVSGAAVALSGLGTRLDGLVDQLTRSYKISEKDLEDVVYHNEAYSRSNSSAESSPVSSKHSVMKEFTPSPKRGSFVSAVIGAIRNAATHPFATKQTADKKPSPVEYSKNIFKELSTESSSDLLDFETEPCLMMESVLEDVPLPDTYSHNMVSSSDSLRRALSVPDPIDEIHERLPRLNDESNSLNNLTQAILNRRKAEDEEDVDDCDSPSESDGGGCTESNNSTAAGGDYSPAVNLVDQVIDVDNLVTKLLKVLRIIQLDNDTCIRELRDDKTSLESKLEAHSSEIAELRKMMENISKTDEIVAIDEQKSAILDESQDSIDPKTEINQINANSCNDSPDEKLLT